MDDLKSVTVSYLRDLARKHLGPGYSKLNKTELIAALAQVVPGLKKLASLAGIPLPKPAAKSAAASGKAAREARGAEKKPERKQESQKKAPEKKQEPERKKEPEGTKVSKKKNPEGKKGSQKKGPEANKAAEKKAPEKKAAPPPQQKAAPPEPKKAAAPQLEPKKTPPPPEPKKAAAQPEPKKATPPPEPKAAAQPEPKAAAQPEPKAAAQPEPKPASPKERKSPAGRSAAAKAEELAQSQRPAQVVNFPPRPRSYRSAEDSWNEDTADTAAERAAASQPAEPLLEGFFVARVVGERELRRHHLTEAQHAPRVVTSNATGYEENLGELPVDYESDVAMALARDPHTLFVSWDFTPATRARAMEGLDSPRPVLRVYEGDKLVRAEEFAIESRSFYIHGLAPGRSYRVEAHFVGRDGRSRRIGPSTHPVRLPQTGLSQDTAVRFMRMPPPPPPAVRAVAQRPLEAPAEPTQQSVVDEGEFITWQRVPLPSSADVAEVLQSRRERIQRQTDQSAVRPAHLQVSARPLGASELAAARGLRLSGASELSGAASRGGASEQIHWTPPPSGRGR